MHPSAAVLAFSSEPFQLESSIPSLSFYTLQLAFEAFRIIAYLESQVELYPDCQWYISAVLQWMEQMNNNGNNDNIDG